MTFPATSDLLAHLRDQVDWHARQSQISTETANFRILHGEVARSIRAVIGLYEGRIITPTTNQTKTN